MRFILYVLLLGIATSQDVRFDCHPEPDANKAECENRKCIWTEDTTEGAPHCYMKSGIGYKLLNKTGDVRTLTKNDGPKSPWDKDLKEILFASKKIGKTLNVKIYLPNRYEPPLDLPLEESKSSEELELTTYDDKDPFYFTVSRKSTHTTLFDTSLGGLIFCDKFIQIATKLPSEAMYGWGENVHPTLKHNFTRYTTWAMFARDEPPSSNHIETKNLYGVHPFYMVLEPDGKAHGVLILNSNAQEVTTAPGPALIYRTIGGILDMYFFPGPTPEEVTQQYLALVGRPFLPAYWGLGFQISRYGYKDLNELINITERNVAAGIPLDTTVADIDYMDRYKDFTTGEKWQGLAEYTKKLHDKGMKLIPIFDVGIQVDDAAFKRALDKGARFLEWERQDQVPKDIHEKYPLVKDKKVMLAVVWPDGHIAFPDFFDPNGNTTDWWISEFANYFRKVPYDGIWIDMNEPAAFGTNEERPWYFDNPDHPNITPLKCPIDPTKKDSQWDVPPYATHAVWRWGKDAHLSNKTMCMLALQGNGKYRHYDVKNIYGWSEAKATLQAQYKATGKRGVVVSRSTFPSGGRYAGHWLGDNSATWADLQSAVIGAQEFNMFGYPYIGSDICGFNGETNEELCLRWQQMGAFHTFMRNHNAINLPPQDPFMWETVTDATIKANLFRYSYLPYLYSLHFEASMYGKTVIRPVFYEYPTDTKTHDLGNEFLWGSSMLIAPVLKKEAISVQAYLPKDDWYSVFDHKYGELIPHGEQTFPAPWASLIPVFVRGGAIIPCQKPNVTTEYTRKNAFKLVIAPKADKADGFLYWDDGDSIVESFSTYSYYHWTFHYKEDKSRASLTINGTKKANNLQIPTLDTLEIFNYKYYADFDNFTLNGNEVEIDKDASSYNSGKKILYITKRNFLDMTAEVTELSWTHTEPPDDASWKCTQSWLLLLTCLSLLKLF
ncbi:unnamed protein product [Cylicocyclus nassatus]|uniref:Maltase n=1 Tax=Cylicocyclus nassatus TaxID=53992 RepID=A0AA36HDW6_CYLNA|nr:unnamed protein product [Cylicocyclus nassatus]